MPRPIPRGRPSAAAAVVALLILATAAAFAWSQHLKRQPLILDRVSFLPVPRAQPGKRHGRGFTPNGDGRRDRVRIRFRITRSDRANVQVIRPGGKLVLTLERDTYLRRYHFFPFYWDGRMRGDGVAPPGRYKLRVRLLGEDRTLVPGGVMRLHCAARRPQPGCPGKGGAA
jgi:hypothetical protein